MHFSQIPRKHELTLTKPDSNITAKLNLFNGKPLTNKFCSYGILQASAEVGTPGQVFITHQSGHQYGLFRLSGLQGRKRLLYQGVTDITAKCYQVDITAKQGFQSGAVQSAAPGQRGRKNALTAPLLVYKVYPDGKEEPVRSLVFSNVTVRVLRDILQTSDKQYVYNYLIGNNYEMPASIVCPAILVEEMELKKSEEKIKKPPILPSPLTEK